MRRSLATTIYRAVAFIFDPFLLYFAKIEGRCKAAFRQWADAYLWAPKPLS